MARRADTDDVLQGALLRPLRALSAVQPASMREFYALSAEQVRRELLDLVKHFKRRLSPLDEQTPAGAKEGGYLEAVGDEENPDLDRWAALHEAVERLPAAEREVFSLAFYHGWNQKQIAELLQVTDRQVRRRWNAALLALESEPSCRLTGGSRMLEAAAPGGTAG